MPDFLPAVELAAKTIRGAGRMRLCRSTLAYIGAAIDCGLPMRISQSSPAASAAAETSPEAVSARTESAAPASGYPAPSAPEIWETGLDHPCSVAADFFPQHTKTSAGPPAAGDDPAGTPPPAGSPPMSNAAAECAAPEFDWVTTAIPVIAGVLADHNAYDYAGHVECTNVRGFVCAEFGTWQEWRDHVALIIAAHIQTPRSATIYDFASGDRPRPLADSPRYRNPRK